MAINFLLSDDMSDCCSSTVLTVQTVTYIIITFTAAKLNIFLPNVPSAETATLL